MALLFMFCSVLGGGAGAGEQHTIDMDKEGRFGGA